MSLFAKIMVVVNLILAVVFLASAGTVLNAMESWKAKHGKDTADLIAERDQYIAQRDQQAAQKDKAIAAAAAAETRAAAAESKLDVLQASNDDIMAHNSRLEEQLQTLATAQSDLQKTNTDLQGIVDNLRTELARAESEKQDARSDAETKAQEIARLEQQLADANDALAAQEMANQSLAKQVDQLNTTIGMYNDKWGPLPEGTMMMKPLDAVVQAVDNANDIYILSVGSKDGVTEGYQFTVHRDGEYIATIVVDKVFDNHASARTKDGLKRKDAQAGDGASTIL